ncbi:unnamed protein product [Oncorhynchus mykiss]|uniref:Uncharacterized protein n=1 Tax=Oncorhynchus mykiss TaxID=8022 RepID=A0A060Z5J7_ONCMY|nr:unnamed protein product [Oncorhynchus mykiss]
MRHIHVELTRGSKEELAPVELPSQDGDLPPPTAPSQVPDLGVMRPGLVVPKPFGHEQLRLQKVYQLSIFSQLGGFSASELPRTSEAQPGQVQPGQVQRTDRVGVKRGQGMGVGVGQGPVSSCIMVDHRDSDGGLSPRSPPPAPLSPGHTPARRPAQHNHDRPVPDLWAPLSPKPSPMVEPHSPPGSRSPFPSIESPPGGNASACSLGNPGGSGEGCRPPLGPPGSLSHRFPPATDPQEPGEGREWGAKLDASGLSSVEKTPSASGLSSVEKTPSTSGLRGISSGPCPAKKKLLSSSDTGESCSEDEGPSTSKRSRLALLAPGLGLASCRGTDAKAAPFWNHLLPNARDPNHTKVRSTD